MEFGGALGQVMRHSMDPRIIAGQGHMSGSILFMENTVAHAKQYEQAAMQKGAAAKAMASQFATQHPYVMATAGVIGAAGIGGLGVYGAYNILNNQ